MRILAVEDDDALADFLRRSLLYAGYQIDLAKTGAGALLAVQQNPPDVILLDWGLPDTSGIELMPRLRAAGNSAVIMLTARSLHSDKIMGLDSGADDYLVKPFALGELLARIRAVSRRAGLPSAQQVLEFAGIRLDCAAHTASYNGCPLNIIGKEFALLELLLCNPRHVLSADAIYERLWDANFAGSNTVQVCVSKLRSKLKQAGAGDLLQTVRGGGYTLREPG